MENLKCSKREKSSAHGARKERRKGMVPGIIYGKEIGNLMFEIGDLELNNGINNTGEHGLVSIEVDGSVHKGLIKEIQRDVVSHKIIHIDLEELQEGKLLTSDVPVIFMGEDEIVRNGAIFQKEKTNIKVQCKAESLPKFIAVDISTLRVGDTLRVKDIEMSKELTFLDELNTVIGAITQMNTAVSVEANIDKGIVLEAGE